MRALTFPRALAVILLLVPSAFAQPACHNYAGNDNNKPNKLYLYFPAAADSTYPEFGGGGLNTSPAAAFNVANLTTYTGTAADLRNSVLQVVKDDYCEFTVQVIATTTAPPTTYSRRNTVAIGSDSDPTSSGTFGLAQAVDTNDATAVDFARVWAGTYQTLYGGAGGALNGANATLDRWARSIGGTAAHEGGHNYGMSHADGLVLAPGEDPLVHHIMASGSHFSGEDRAGYRRHFSDHEYSILAANIGLALQTMWNWDLINPNAETGVKLQMDFLSTMPSIVVAWTYTGNLSPWGQSTVTGPTGTQVFKGVTYNRYMLEWSTGQNWSNGPSGQVPGGVEFHVGAGLNNVDFTQPDAIIITDCRLLDSTGAVLAMHPRVVGYDSGNLDQASDTMNLRFFNFRPEQLVVQNVEVQELPRVLSIDAMMSTTKELVDVRGDAFEPWAQTRRTVLAASKPLAKEKELAVPIAKMSQAPHVLNMMDTRACEALDRLRGPDVAKCRPGLQIDLFPATSVFIKATVVDPKARYWDRTKKKYVTGPLASHLFYQIAGRRLTIQQRGLVETVQRLEKQMPQ
jgi:hypothetical protein